MLSAPKSNYNIEPDLLLLILEDQEARDCKVSCVADCIMIGVCLLLAPLFFLADTWTAAMGVSVVLVAITVKLCTAFRQLTKYLQLNHSVKTRRSRLKSLCQNLTANNR